MKSILIIVTKLFFVVLLFTSCESSKLNRNKAKQLILNNFINYESSEVKLYPNGYEYASLNISRSSEVDLHRDLDELGLINLVVRNNKFFPGVKSMELTDYGRKYVLNERIDRHYIYLTCKTSDLEFVDITGISQANDHKAIVKYNIFRKVTPFGLAFYLVDDTIEISSQFTLYDDGWRIED